MMSSYLFFKYIIIVVHFMFGVLLIIVHSLIMASCIWGECYQFSVLYISVLLATFCFVVKVLGSKPRDSHILGMGSPTLLHFPPLYSLEMF